MNPEQLLLSMKQHLNNLSQHFAKWFKTRRELILPVSVSTAQLQLKTAFASTISTSKGFLFADYKYTGEINDTELNIKFTVHGRGIAHYIMNGKLYPHPIGSRLEIIVADKGPIQLLPPAVILTFFIVLTRDYLSIFVALIFMLLLFAGLSWHRNSAAEAVSALIYNVVTRET